METQSEARIRRDKIAPLKRITRFRTIIQRVALLDRKNAAPLINDEGVVNFGETGKEGEGEGREEGEDNI